MDIKKLGDAYEKVAASIASCKHSCQLAVCNSMIDLFEEMAKDKELSFEMTKAVVELTFDLRMQSVKKLHDLCKNELPHAMLIEQIDGGMIVSPVNDDINFKHMQNRMAWQEEFNVAEGLE